MILKDVFEGGCCEEWSLPFFVILDAVLCALKCIFVLRQFIMAHQYYFSFDMTTLLQPDTRFLVFFPRVADILFIYFDFTFICFPLQHISKYTTVLLNKFIYKVNAAQIPLLCCFPRLFR